jgi:flavin reductase (DIM6/NTAB) family NADH-FMN oxidoreductase RutF
MMAFDPPVLALGCNIEHRTARNILDRKEFVVNVPGAELVKVVWKSSELPHPRPVEAAGLTPMPVVQVQPPRIAECKAHKVCSKDEIGRNIALLESAE